MQPFETGSLVRSKAGHDKDDIVVIIGQQGEYVWIADGKRRTVEKPYLSLQIIRPLDRS